MYLDEHYSFGGGPGPLCRACGDPFHTHRPATHVAFPSDPTGSEGLTGDYHPDCARPFASIARVLAALSRLG